MELWSGGRGGLDRWPENGFSHVLQFRVWCKRVMQAHSKGAYQLTGLWFDAIPLPFSVTDQQPLLLPPRPRSSPLGHCCPGSSRPPSWKGISLQTWCRGERTGAFHSPKLNGPGPPTGGRAAIDGLTWPAGLGLTALIVGAESLFSQHGRRLGHPFSARVVWEGSRGQGLLCWRRALELTKSLGQGETPLGRLTHKS